MSKINYNLVIWSTADFQRSQRAQMPETRIWPLQRAVKPPHLYRYSFVNTVIQKLLTGKPHLWFSSAGNCHFSSTRNSLIPSNSTDNVTPAHHRWQWRKSEMWEPIYSLGLASTPAWKWSIWSASHAGSVWYMAKPILLGFSFLFLTNVSFNHKHLN